MGNRFKRMLILSSMLLVMGVVGTLALPKIVAAVPTVFRHRLPPALQQLVTTPLPTALPAPAMPVLQPQITIPPLAAVPSATPTTGPTLVPTYTPLSSPASPTAELEAAPSPLATPLPSAAPWPSATPWPTHVPLPPAAQIDGLQNMAQKFNNCGPTNLSVNLAFYEEPVDQMAIAQVLRPNYDDRNVSPEELVRYVVENTSLAAMLFSGGDLETLKRFIAAGFPVVIESGLIPSKRDGWMGHYLTLFGYDDAQAQFLGIDTYLGPWDGSGRPETYEGLAGDWRHFNYTFYVVFPPEQESEVRRLAGPALSDPLSMWQNAAIRAQAETELEPDNAFSWFNLGTNLTRLGMLTGRRAYHQDAAAAFDQAREIGLPARMLWYQFAPYEAYLAVDRPEDVFVLAGATLAYEGGRGVEETFLYQGHAHKLTGDSNAAAAAYRRALTLNPAFTQARDALDSLNEGLESDG